MWRSSIRSIMTLSHFYSQEMSDFEYDEVFDEEEIVRSQQTVSEYNHMWDLSPEQLLKHPIKIPRQQKVKRACSAVCRIILWTIGSLILLLAVLAVYYRCYYGNDLMGYIIMKMNESPIHDSY